MQEKNSVENDTDESIQSEAEEHNPRPEDSSADEILSRHPRPRSKEKRKINGRCRGIKISRVGSRPDIGVFRPATWQASSQAGIDILLELEGSSPLGSNPPQRG